MAASSTAIANLALAHIGQERIESLSEESAAARWANEFYSIARDFVTELRLWRYAKRTLLLSETTNDRDSDYAYAYTRPSDCFVFHLILPRYGAFDPRDPIRFEVEGDVIYTDEYQARGVYCRQITDTTKFPPSIDMVMSWQLAHLLCKPLNQDSAQKRATQEGFEAAVRHAIAIGQVESAFADVRTADEAAPDWQQYR